MRVSLTASGTGAVRLAWHRWNEDGGELATIWVEGWTRFEPGNRTITFDPVITSAPITVPVLYVANEHTVSMTGPRRRRPCWSSPCLSTGRSLSPRLSGMQQMKVY